MKRLRITVGEKTYDVEVETLDMAGNAVATPVAPASVTPVAIGSVATSSSAAPKTEAAPGVVQSPLGGNVVALQVTVGQAVQEGDQLVVLEAMKMNTYISAPESGKIVEVFVKVGDGVREGQPLLRIGE